MLTVYDDDDRVFDALCAGARGYLLKKTPPRVCWKASEEAAQGGAPMTPEIARRVVTLFRKVRRHAGRIHLTPHETAAVEAAGGRAQLQERLRRRGNYTSASHKSAFTSKQETKKLEVHSKSESGRQTPCGDRLVEDESQLWDTSTQGT